MTQENTNKPTIDEVIEAMEKHIKFVVNDMIGDCNMRDCDCDDLMQDFYYEIIEKYDSYNPEKGSVKTYFSKIIENKRNQIYRYKNADKRRVLEAAKVLSIEDDCLDYEDKLGEEESIYTIPMSEVVEAATPSNSDIDKLISRIDYEELVAKVLTPEEQKILSVIENSRSRTEAIKKLNLSNGSFYRAIERIKEKLSKCGELF